MRDNPRKAKRQREGEGHLNPAAIKRHSSVTQKHEPRSRQVHLKEHSLKDVNSSKRSGWKSRGRDQERKGNPPACGDERRKARAPKPPLPAHTPPSSVVLTLLLLHLSLHRTRLPIPMHTLPFDAKVLVPRRIDATGVYAQRLIAFHKVHDEGT
ncbi:hypothetical protein NMY22_g1727 [Coprinellus aureogranulatus]|nr:hypothetical protein NMY22_g1727 [Coprinellus aureogranulatus]